MNFSLHSTTGQSLAKLPPGAQDLPRLQKPVRRRLSAGKIVGHRAGRRARAWPGLSSSPSPAMSKPIKGLFFEPEAATSSRTTVRLGALPITVVEKGSLESSKNQDVYLPRRGRTTIIMIKPEGTRVKKGEVVCELDSAALRDQLDNQKITTKSAEANFRERQADARSRRDRGDRVRRGHLTSRTWRRSRARSSWPSPTCRAPRTGSTGRSGCSRRATSRWRQKVSEELTLKKARFALEQAQSKKKVLVEYTKDKTIKELESEVEKARSDELAKKATWELEKSKEKKLERQIAACKIKAPSDGLVVYANDPTRAFGSNQPQIEEGATVRERQKIFSLPDISQMQVNTKVHESQIDKVKPGMKAKIRVDAFVERAARRHGDRRGRPCPIRQLLQLGHQGLHDQGEDRRRRCRGSGRA